METIITVVALAIFGALIVVVVVVGYRRGVAESARDDARKAGLAAAAAQRGWSFLPREPALTVAYVGAPFGRGNGHNAFNVIHGTHDGRHFAAFDYEYFTRHGSGTNKTTQSHAFSVLVLGLGLTTPGLEVGPTSGVGTLINAVTGRDVEIGNPAFDQFFTVTSPSPEFAIDFLTPAVVEVVMHHPQLAWRLEGQSMLVVRSGQHSPEEIDAKLYFMDAVLDRVPEHVRARLGG